MLGCRSKHRHLASKVRNMAAATRLTFTVLTVLAILLAGQARAADSIEGQVLGAGAPIAKSTVTLWSASADAPKQLAQTQSGDDGRFHFKRPKDPLTASCIWLPRVANQPRNKGSGDNPAIALIAVLGNKPPTNVVINEFTTVASVWTNAQFLDGTAIKGNPLGLRIAAGNVPNFVDLATGGYGEMIQDGFNSTETPTMANFGTLSNVLAGCITNVTQDACKSLFVAAGAATAKNPQTHSPRRYQSRTTWPTGRSASSRSSISSIQ